MSLVEGVENIVVSALAQQDDYARVKPEHRHVILPEPDSSVVTRDIINAIADELAGPNSPWDGMRSGEWLRSQANPDSAEEK